MWERGSWFQYSWGVKSFSVLHVMAAVGWHKCQYSNNKKKKNRQWLSSLCRCRTRTTTNSLDGLTWAAFDFGAVSVCVGMNWVGMCFHDPLPSDVRRKNYIPSFSDFRQNPLNPKSPSEEKKKKIQSVSVELDLMKSRTTTSLFLQIRPCPKHGVPTSSSACRLSTLALSQIPVDGSQSTVQIFLFFFKTHPIRISPVRFGSGTSRGRALKRSLIHPTFFSSPPVTQERVQRREGC